MLARVIEAILDFAGERRYAAQMIQCEVGTTEGWADVPRRVFAIFFGIRGRLLEGDSWAADWSPATDAAWSVSC